VQILFKLKRKKNDAFKSRLTNCYWNCIVIQNENGFLIMWKIHASVAFVTFWFFFFFQILMLGWLLTWVIADKVVFLMFELDCYWKWIMGFWNGIDVYKISEYKVLVLLIEVVFPDDKFQLWSKYAIETGIWFSDYLIEDSYRISECRG